VIAALYVQTGGVYYGLDDVDPWDGARDARLYAGPWSVVAHPPCARWCQLAGLVQHVYGYRIGDDGGTFSAALDAVRRFGGVLEHPAHSLAWAHYGLTEPINDGWMLSLDGGWVAHIEQERYGHGARKPTWLYAYGCELPALRWGRRSPAPDDPGWWVRSDRPHEHKKGSNRMRGKRASRTPAAFRDVLLDMARSVAQHDLNVHTAVCQGKAPAS
jgi:hypothetical protein